MEELNIFEKDIKKIIENWDKINDKFKVNICPNKYNKIEIAFLL